jgi:hypothetical protein
MTVPAELIDLAMTGAKPGCRGDARFYLENAIAKIRADERAKVAEEIEKRGRELRMDEEDPISRDEWACFTESAAIARGDQ